MKDDTELRVRVWLAAAAAAAAACACAPMPPYPPGYAACHQRMQRHADELMPAFGALGYRPAVQLFIDEKMPDANGLHAMDNVMGDAAPNGRIRLRPALCGNDGLARAVVAHEMAHVPLQHRSPPASGLVLAWEGPPRQENEANALGLAALQASGGHPGAERFLECRLMDCGAGGRNGTAPFRAPPRAAP